MRDDLGSIKEDHFDGIRSKMSTEYLFHSRVVRQRVVKGLISGLSSVSNCVHCAVFATPWANHVASECHPFASSAVGDRGAVCYLSFYSNLPTPVCTKVTGGPQ